MPLNLSQKAAGAWAVLTRRYDNKIDSELGHWQGRLHVTLFDHGWLRTRWTNEGRIADGVFRSNQPDARVLAMWKARGVVDVLALRPDRGARQDLQAETCAALGLRLINVAMETRAAPQRETLLALLDALEDLRRPALIHCKSGADRTGLVAVIWAIHMEGRPLAEARLGLTLRHLHVRWGSTGVLDRFVDLYAARLERGPIPFRDWVATEYDPADLP